MSLANLKKILKISALTHDGSMYAIYGNIIGGILMVNVIIYTIHGSYGFAKVVVVISGGQNICSQIHDIMTSVSDIMAISGSNKWRYLPYIRPIFQAYVRKNIPRKYGPIWYSTSILGFTRLPRKRGRQPLFPCLQIRFKKCFCVSISKYLEYIHIYI